MTSTNETAVDGLVADEERDIIAEVAHMPGDGNTIGAYGEGGAPRSLSEEEKRKAVDQRKAVMRDLPEEFKRRAPAGIDSIRYTALELALQAQGGRLVDAEHVVDMAAHFEKFLRGGGAAAVLPLKIPPAA